MAISSSKILNSAKSEVTQMLTGLGTPIDYQGLGVGNDTNAAAETDTGLKGDELKFKDGNVSFFENANSSYIAQWNSSWVYGDLTTHVYKEVVVSQNASNLSGTCLLRAVYDSVTLGVGDSLGITAQISVSEG